MIFDVFKGLLAGSVSRLENLVVGTKISIEGVQCVVESRSTYRAEYEYLVEYKISGHDQYTHIVWNGIDGMEMYVKYRKLNHRNIFTERGLRVSDDYEKTKDQKDTFVFEGDKFHRLHECLALWESEGRSEEVLLVYYMYHSSHRIHFEVWQDRDGDEKIQAYLLKSVGMTSVHVL